VRQKPCLDLEKRRLTPEPWRGRARRNLRPRPRGSDETVSASEAQGSGELWFGPEARELDDLGPVFWRLWMICFVLCVFYRF